MIKALVKRVTRPVYKRYRDLVDRVSNLETVVDCLLDNPTWTSGDAVGFNGQIQRKGIVRDIFGAIPFEAIIETGTWIGDTTGYLASTTGLPVHTCEVNRRFHALARKRLADIPAAAAITFHLGDSRACLRELAAMPITRQTCFFYLDAHWYADLPLVEELDIICRHWDRSVVMIDDFAVPGDPGYVHSKGCSGEILRKGMVARAADRHDLVIFFPTAPSSEETGARCGCAVLARRGELSDKLTSLPSLRAG